jgi:calcium/calmodulin-dependent protein kinase (CaM kinase) II
MADVREELLTLNQRLLDSIAGADWKAYQDLCDPSLTCFEPEAQGQLIQGLAFHEFYFKLGPAPGQRSTTMASPYVRLLGDTAIVAYVRVNQRQQPDGVPVTRTFEETRVWQRIGGQWKHVHFHRSMPT